ncbi:MAG TPA: isoprenylcysteine carboxylmethyltransferase family protein [Candidatus Binatia bacterium]|nr:isoprenylcysteine carboxylmethyltransferase family protein [Candidatus Binatia bacterium]
MTPLRAAGAIWSVLAVVWLATSFGRNPAQRRENPLARLSHMLFMAAAFYLLSSAGSTDGLLGRRFLPETSWLPPLGVALTAAGVAFAIWARLHLGKQWSGDVTIRRDHELIRTGPYTHIRHPIYTGILTAMLGTALIVGEVRGLAAVGIATIGFWRKALKEEAFLEEEFGPKFEEHKRRTGFFLPRVG